MSYSWVEFHGAVTHFPVALIIAGFVFELGALVLKKPEWRIVSFWSLLFGVLGSAAALVAGWMAVGTIYTSAQPLPAIVATHRIGAFVASGAALILLAWRASVRDRLNGPALSASLVLFLAAAVAVGYTGFLGGQMVFGAPKSASPAKAVATPPLSGPQLMSMGSDLFQQEGCINCHQMGKAGGSVGPDLTHEGADHPDIKWQIAHLQDPAKMDPGSSMPPFSDLTQQQLSALATYVARRK